jgi:hypothetical protein
MMTNEAADALCTLISLGFAKDIKTLSKFEYDKDGDLAKYQKVVDKFKDVGVDISIGKSVAKETFPIIIATTSRINQTDPTVLDTETKLSRDLDRLVKSLDLSGLYGAYIGGYSSVSRIELVGASNLALYAPTYRAATDPAIKTAYENAVTVSNKVIDLLKEYNSITGGKKVDGVTISIPLINDKVTTAYSTGKVFKSYHGMIEAMIKYGTVFDPNTFIFEIACSSTTSKVSSCFPCSTFMSAQGTPPSSIHLGRGDNWNIPDSCSKSMKDSWNESIKTWYASGMASVSLDAWNSFISDYTTTNVSNQLIPDMFLEALTFESSFTDKIESALS